MWISQNVPLFISDMWKQKETKLKVKLVRRISNEMKSALQSVFHQTPEKEKQPLKY